MQIIIKQKYWTIGDKFKITDEKGNVVFYAERQFDRFMNNVVLFDASGAPLGRMQAELKKVFTSWFDVTDASGRKAFSISEKIPFFSFRKAKTVNGNLDCKIKCGPIHMKAFISDGQGGYDKTPVVKARKKIFSLTDTYVIDIDDTRIFPSYGAFLGIWYDMMNHRGH